jgi:hypothetical protein
MNILIYKTLLESIIIAGTDKSQSGDGIKHKEPYSCYKKTEQNRNTTDDQISVFVW